MTTNPKVLEAWFTLMAEAMRGTQEAQEAFKALSNMPGGPESMGDWMAKFMPGAMSSASGSQPEAFETWLTEWQRIMGVVPRSRYLALLEKCDMLQGRLEKAEAMITTLKSMLNNKDHQEAEAKKVLDTWGTMLEDTLKMQSEWMRNWTEAAPNEGDPPSEGTVAEVDSTESGQS